MMAWRESSPCHRWLSTMLTEGVHYILGSNENIYLQDTGLQSWDLSGVKMTFEIAICNRVYGTLGLLRKPQVRCAMNPSQKVIVKNKIGGLFRIGVGAMLEFKNIEFDGLESMGKGGCRFQRKDCCQLNQNGLVVGINGEQCSQPYEGVQQNCIVPGPQSMFYFKQGSATSKSNPGAIKLTTVIFKNMFFELSSIIHIPSNSGHVVVKNVQVINMGTCGTIISNLNPYLTSLEEINTQPYLNKYGNYISKRSARIAIQDLKYKYSTTPLDECNTLAFKCSSIVLDYLTVSNLFLGIPLRAQLSQSVIPQMGYVTNLSGFKGAIVITNSIFSSNLFRLTSVGIYDNQVLISSNIFTHSFQVQEGLIVASQMQGQFEMGNVSFIGNGGFSGSLLNVDGFMGSAVVIKGAVFIKNSLVNQGTLLNVVCGVWSGLYLELMKFEQNIRVPIKETQSEVNPHLIHIGYSDQSVQYTGSPATSHITKQSIKLDHTLLTTNQFTENFYNIAPLTLISNVQNVEITKEVYSLNSGGLFKEAAVLYSPLTLHLSDFSSAFKLIWEPLNHTLVLMGVIKHFNSLTIKGIKISQAQDFTYKQTINYRHQLLDIHLVKNSVVVIDGIEIPQINGGDEGTIGRYLKGPIQLLSDNHQQYYNVTGGRIIRGFMGPLIKFNYVSTLGTVRMQNVKLNNVVGVSLNVASEQQYGYLYEESIVPVPNSEVTLNNINSFSLNNITIDQVDFYRSFKGIILLQQNSNSLYKLNNISITNYGTGQKTRAYSSPIIIQPYYFKNQSSVELVIEHLSCKITNVYEAGCIVMPTSTSSKSHGSVWINIRYSQFINTTSRYGAFMCRSGYHQFQTYFTDCQFINNTSTEYYAGADFNIQNLNQRGASFTLDSVYFKNSRNKLDPLEKFHNRQAYSFNTGKVVDKNKIRLNNVIFDCGEAQPSPEQSVKANFYESNATQIRENLMDCVIVFGKHLTTINGMIIKSCQKINYSAIAFQEQGNVTNLTIAQCTGMASAGIGIRSAIHRVVVKNYHAIGLVGKYSAALILFTGLFNLTDSVIEQSFGVYSSGLYSNKCENMDLVNVTFKNNIGVLAGPINLQFFVSHVARLYKVKFYDNIVKQGGLAECTLVTLRIYHCEFKRNKAQVGYAGLFSIKSKLIIRSTIFELDGTEKLQTSDGGFISSFLESNLDILNCTFSNGYFRQGAGILVDGKSIIDIRNSTFRNLRVVDRGAAMYLTNFNQINLNSILMENCWGDANNIGGTSIYANQGVLKITGLTVRVTRPLLDSNLIYFRSIHLTGSSLTIHKNTNTSVRSKSPIQLGGGMHMVDMKFIDLNQVDIKGVEGTQIGGGIAILHTNQQNQPPYSIKNAQIRNNKVLSKGGGIYYENGVNITFASITIEGNEALNGGGFYYHSNDQFSQSKVEFQQKSQVIANRAGQQGGGFDWNYYSIDPAHQPIIIMNNTASTYGNDISSSAQKIKIMNIGRHLTQLNDQKSGGNLPSIKFALIDPQQQIVTSDSKSIAQLKAIKQITQFNIVLKGETSLESQQGQFLFKDVQIIADPGATIQLQIVISGGIDLKLPDNKNSTNIMSIKVGMRKCLVGEAFIATGECRRCEDKIEYLLKTQKETGTCKRCVDEIMICRGGSNVGPRPGYWRSSNTSSNFYPCLRAKSCQGMRDGSQTGQCDQGFEDKLCAKCAQGYSMSGEYNCLKCPSIVYNILRLMGTAFLSILVVVIMVKSTIQSSLKRKKLESILIKILMNHFQLIFLTSTFEFKWPKEVQVFFSTQSPVANVSTQFLSMDCFLGLVVVGNSYFTKLVTYSLLPVAMVVVSVVFWKLKTCRRPGMFTSRTISTCIITMFLIHPSIVQTMFDALNCTQIESRLYLKKQIQVECYTHPHQTYSLFVIAPSILIWGAGIPLFAGLILCKNRKQLHKNALKQRYGFLFNGYKRQRFYWESIIMYRKILVIFIAVQLKQAGTMVQAFVVSLLLVVFLMVNMMLQPFVIQTLNRLETLSINASLLTVYCGFYFLSHRPDIYQSSDPLLKTADNGLRMGYYHYLALFGVILISNGLFFLFWTWKFLTELLKSFRSTFPRIYLFLCLFKQKQKLEQELQAQKVNEENDELRGELELILNSVLKAYDRKQLMLNKSNLEKLSVYLNIDKIKEEINYKDLRKPKEDDQHAKIRNKRIKTSSSKFDKPTIEQLTEQTIIQHTQSSVNQTDQFMPESLEDYSMTKNKITHLPSQRKRKHKQPTTFILPIIPQQEDISFTEPIKEKIYERRKSKHKNLTDKLNIEFDE